MNKWIEINDTGGIILLMNTWNNFKTFECSTFSFKNSLKEKFLDFLLFLSLNALVPRYF